MIKKNKLARKSICQKTKSLILLKSYKPESHKVKGTIVIKTNRKKDRLGKVKKLVNS